VEQILTQREENATFLYLLVVRRRNQTNKGSLYRSFGQKENKTNDQFEIYYILALDKLVLYTNVGTA